MKLTPGNAWIKALPVLALLVGGGFGYALTLFGTYPLFGSVSKLLAVLIGSAWVTLLTFATKIGDITEAPSLSLAEHQRLESKCKRSVRRIWLWSMLNFCFVIVVLIPAALVDAKVPVYHAIMVFAGMASGLSVYSIVLHAYWQEELREFRSTLRLREREKSQNKQMTELFQEAKSSPEDNAVSEIGKLNRVKDWPKNGTTPL
ncbi:hypothetical protein [Azonexus sp.]|uniref:hypothetical protein n=1 Tax=Azonexus sp. TaxID=1872668 RepID=UPI0027BA5EE1|nr:hypothetical protein [Azonexus sp.]